MKPGDLVRVQGNVWLVEKVDPKRSRSAILLGTTGARIEVPLNLEEERPDECEILANPTRDWIVILVPHQPRLGRVVSVTAFDGRAWHPLAPYERWVMTDPTGSGGNLFLHPEAPLVAGGLLRVEHQRGPQVVRVPIKVGTVQQRRTWSAPAPKPGPRTVYDRIGEDDDKT